MPASVIIDGVIYGSPVYTAPDYNKNVGGLVIVTFDGVQSVIDAKDLYKLKVSPEEITDISEAPAFMHENILLIQHEGIVADSYIYPLRKEDVKPLGVALSKRYNTCSLLVFARILSVWKNGEQVIRMSLDDFYNNITEEERKRFDAH